MNILPGTHGRALIRPRQGGKCRVDGPAFITSPKHPSPPRGFAFRKFDIGGHRILPRSAPRTYAAAHRYAGVNGLAARHRRVTKKVHLRQEVPGGRD